MLTALRLVADAATANGRAATNAQNASDVSIGRRLRVRRTARGISEREVWEELGIDPDDLLAYEAGTKRVRANLLLRIANLLDVAPDYFFRGYTADELAACLESFPSMI
jgi:transcriptional regulator with XRE-family HTH domain